MKKETIVAPLIITIIVVFYYGVMLWAIMKFVDYFLLKVILSLVPLLFIVTFLLVFKERYQEIRKEDNNDISKY